MISLRDTQRAFCSAMFSGDASWMTQLVLADGVPVEQRMQIYANSNRLGFLAAMQSTFPVIEKLAGDAWFEQRVRRYQLQFPSRCGDLQYVGSRFAEFLRAELAGTDFEYFVDVARLEWAYQEVLIAAESDVLDPAVLGAVAAEDYERLVFAPRTALRLIESPYPVLAIWQAHQPGAAEADISLDAGPSRVLLIRRDDHVEMRELSAASAGLLGQCLQSVCLGEAVETLAAAQVDFELGSALRQLVGLSSFSAFHLHAARPHKISNNR